LADPNRLRIAAVGACVLVLGAVLGHLGGVTNAPGGDAGARSMAEEPSKAPAVALSSSWFCAGATASPGSLAAGQLVFDNAGPTVVRGSVRLVAEDGYAKTLSVSVPAGGTSALTETLPGAASGEWVGAMVNLYGGMASVQQVATTAHGTSSQPCASSPATQWYFVGGAALRNASDELFLLDPYPVAAVADLEFTTNEGREAPLAFEGVVVPARGLAVLNVGAELGRRPRVAVTVTARTGQIVAFQTELVTTPPAGSALLGTPGASNPVIAVAGFSLTLGSTRAAKSWWWPLGGEGPGLSETYDVYNPGPTTARLTLRLISGGAGSGLASSSQLVVGPYGYITVTTNGQPWALPGTAYATHLQSTNGTPVVAERTVLGASPSLQRGLGAVLGQVQASQRWLLPTRRLAPKQLALSQTWLEVADPGKLPAVVSVTARSGGKLAPVPGVRDLDVAAGQRSGLRLPRDVTGEALVVSSSAPIVVEVCSCSPLVQAGTNLSPAVVLGEP